jgi:hypothetical protein
MHCGLATETLWSPRGMNEGGEDGVLDAGLERFAMQIELYFYSTMKIRPLSFKIVSIPDGCILTEAPGLHPCRMQHFHCDVFPKYINFIIKP